MFEFLGRFFLFLMAVGLSYAAAVASPEGGVLVTAVLSVIFWEWMS
ncbi:MAG: hypothetical protein V3W41_22480 [Planctomycetota bacterium]